MAGQNPFAAPKADVLEQHHEGGHRGFRMEGNTLIMPKTSSLPPLCVRCGAATTFRMEKTLSWHPPWIFALLLINLIIYAIAASITSKRATVGLPICEEHKSKRTRALMIGLGVTLLGIGGCVAGVSVDQPGIAVVGGALFPIVGIIVLMVGMRTVTVKKIDKDFVHLSHLPQPILTRIFQK